MIRSIVKIISLSTVLAVIAFSQSTFSVHTDSFSLIEPDSSRIFHLTKNFIFESSITVRCDSSPISSFTFNKSTNSVLIDSASLMHCRQGNLFISYSYLPLALKPSYSLRTLSIKSDSSDSKKKRISILQTEGVFTNIFGSEISKSGSISRGFIVGSNRDLTLSSGFRLQMSGKLSDDIDILAALTDENTPLQPQGNTQTLQEIDNIFVEVKSPVYTATLGDFQFNSLQSEFVNVNRKLQGAKIDAHYEELDPKTQVMFTAASTKGKFHTNQFQGIDGVQGPYRVTGKNNERNIIVIAGTEKVYVDGELMTRGENNDYSIEYGSAEITFSTTRLMTSASRIVVDFEYSDRQFTRNFLGGSVKSEFHRNISVMANYLREGDDQDSPIDVSLTSEDKNILSQAGNKLASKTGIVYVGRDSSGLGKGYYVVVDTIIVSDTLRFYRYQPNDPNSVYTISFSNVGAGSGDYIREGIGKYRFVGVKAGQFLPIVFLPSPQLHQLYSVQTIITPINDLEFNGEYAASSFDQNRFSGVDDNSNSGAALKMSLKYSAKNIHLGNSNIGSLEFFMYERYKDSRFTTFDRIDVVEFGRKWSTDSISIVSSVSEEIREERLTYTPISGVILNSGFGTLNQGSQFSSTRYDGALNVKIENYPNLAYAFEQISGNENFSGLSNLWFRQKGQSNYTFGFFTPSMRFEEENREVLLKTNDSLTSPSFSFLLYSPKLDVKNFYGIDLSSEVEWRNDKSFYSGEVVPQSNSFTQTYGAAVKEMQNFSLSSAVIVRKKVFEKKFQSTNTNQQTTLVKIQSRYRPFSQGIDLDAFYEAAAQRTAKLERVFYKVRKGEGQYVWVDANGNGIVDLDNENEFKPDRYDGEYVALTLNSDELIPVVNLKISSRLKLTPSRFLTEQRSFFQKIISNISTETFARVEERSTEKNTDAIYFLHLNRFLQPTTTLSGFQFIQQDLFLFESNPGYSIRFRFNQRKGLNSFATGNEKNYSRERSIRTRLQISNDISNQTDLVMRDDNALSASQINQSRQIQSSSFITDLSYRPEQFLEIGLKLETTQADDIIGPIPISANFNGQTLRSVIAFQGNGQIRLDFSREEVLIAQNPIGYIPPYELTSGREIGKNFLWSAASEYRLAGNLQFSLQYNGRTTSKANIIHTGRMEVRAFF